MRFERLRILVGIGLILSVYAVADNGHDSKFATSSKRLDGESQAEFEEPEENESLFDERAALFDSGRAPSVSYLDRSGWKSGTCVDDLTPDREDGALLMLFKDVQTNSYSNYGNLGAMVRIKAGRPEFFENRSRESRRQTYESINQSQLRLISKNEPVKNRAIHFHAGFATRHQGGPYMKVDYYVRLVRVEGRLKPMFRIVSEARSVDNGPIKKRETLCL